MERRAVRELLERVRRGEIGVGEALDRLRESTVATLGFAHLDLERALRRGHPEAVYGAGKTPEQIVEIVGRLQAAGQTALVTRVGPEMHEAVRRHHPQAEWHPLAGAVVVRAGRPVRKRPGVTVVTAGTSDIGVGDEAALTAELMGSEARRIWDVGVAGLHRLLAHRDQLLASRVIVVAAGMEGALPSVVAGLVDVPVIAVPTSAGYGAGAGGIAPLLGMLNSCSPGVAVVNIDNGYGAGYLAALIHGMSRGRNGVTARKNR